jgi:general secretion pathway protein D
MVWGQAGSAPQAEQAPPAGPPAQAGSAPGAAPESAAPAVKEDPPRAPEGQGGQAEKPAQSAGKPAATPRLITLNFRGASLDSVIEAVAEASGLDFIKTADVGGTVTIVERDPLSVDQALNVLGEVLRIRGATFVRSGNRVTIMGLTEARTVSDIVYNGSSAEEVPDTSEVINWIQPLHYVDAARLARDLTKLMPAYANLAANSESNTLIITDTADNVKRLLAIVQAVDNPQVSTAAVKVFVLRNASAADLVTPLTKLFTTSETSSSAQARIQQRFQMMARGGPPGPDGPGPESTTADTQESSGRQQPRIVADDRTNSLIVGASTEMLTVIEGVVEQLDAEASGALLDLRVFILKNADAEDVAKVVENVFGSTSSSQSGSARNQGDRLRFGPPEAGGAETATPTATLKNTVRVAADTRTNAVVVTATAENLQIIGQLIKQLDDEAAATPQSVAIIPVLNAEPADIAQVLSDILTTDTQKVNLRRASTTTRTGQTQATTQTRTTTTGTATNRTTTTLPGSTGSGGTGSTRTSTGLRGEAP